MDFTSQPTLIRTLANGIEIHQNGGGALVGGTPVSMTTRDDILANRRHYLRDMLGSQMARIESGEIAAVVHAEARHLGSLAPANGRTTYILITAEQAALGAAERQRWAEWVAGAKARRVAEQTAERAFDAGVNEGGEGYNPHRRGAGPTYGRKG